ncbi:MFS multidrug transporter-like protein [Lindgomyces ingoldianus]|uniref:MFS multidrug transporter-like protein n=1 Tax=Lindgomyces ingoldianus TaxID=673940 RepID=A0ACB6QEI4_9PLEO|nr:MFS multidrug transporter-like protein [Lindgomyces ingoldianus]KAF2464555.1 MFS multidrug transporter-like protein [Lindgomyces ingoldianus]
MKMEESKVESPAPETVASEDVDVVSTPYILGWRLHVITIALCLSIFLASLEVSIVATSLVAISNSLKSFEQSSWIINSYMLTYTGFLIIWAKLSDIFGRKLFILSSILLFVIFSGACGAAQTTEQLIVFRAFQGLAGAGTYSLTVVIFFELVPPAKFATYTSLVSGVLAIALLLGPLLGGAITNGTTWRWIFLINVPVGIVAVLALILTVPNGFPHHIATSASKNVSTKTKLLSKNNFKRIDFAGTTLLLAASILLVAAFEEAARGRNWDSALIISFLVVSILIWVVFIVWERRVTLASGIMEPIFPWRFLQSRVRIGMILSMILTGGPFTVCVIQIPQRFQAVNGLSSLDAGIRLLPFAIASPFGSALSPAICKKCKVPPVYLCFVGSALQIIGFALLSTLPDSSTTFHGQYGYQFVAGVGVGINLACLVVMAPFTVEERDKSVAMSSMVQFRTLGGALCLAIASSVFNDFIRARFLHILSPQEVDVILKSTEAIKFVPADIRMELTKIFSRGYDLQFKILIGFAAAQIPASALMWKRNQVMV